MRPVQLHEITERRVGDRHVIRREADHVFVEADRRGERRRVARIRTGNRDRRLRSVRVLRDDRRRNAFRFVANRIAGRDEEAIRRVRRQ